VRWTIVASQLRYDPAATREPGTYHALDTLAYSLLTMFAPKDNGIISSQRG
jgi:hypothetical protein